MIKTLEGSIIAINYILRLICFSLISRVGYDQETKKILHTTYFVFGVQFINTAIMLLIVNAGMKDNPVTYGVVGSSLRDFNRTWFKIVGNTIVGTLLLNVIMPILESVFYKMLKVCYRAMDRGCCQKDKYVTNMTSIAEYIDLYSGIDFEMQDGFNAFLIIVFVTFMFGFGIPLMFPIATVAMYVLSRTEEYNLYYFYR